jgi:acyl carrier protein
MNMDLNEFIAHVAEQFEETDASQIVASTKFQELDEYSSLIALSLIAMIDEEYDVTIKGNDLRSAVTIEDLFNTVKSKKE